MDRETRDLISGIVSYVFEKQDFLKTVNWVLEADDQVRSPEDLALGYFLGSIMNITVDVVSRKNLNEKLEKTYRKSLEKIYGKEGAVKSIEERDRKLERMRAKGGRRMETRLTDEETSNIKNMLLPMIASFREKIRKEGALRRV